MWLFLRSSHLKLGKQSNKSSGNEEIKFPSKYKNWNSGKKNSFNSRDQRRMQPRYLEKRNRYNDNFRNQNELIYLQLA